jgi:hypothetical protein
MDCIPRVAGKRCGTSQARASMLASGGQPTEVFHSLSRSSHHRDPARQAVQEWGRGSEQGFRASTFAAPRDEHVPPAGLGCRRRCVGRQWKPRPRKLWQTSCRAQVGIPMAPPGLPLGRWIMAGGPPGRGSVLPRLCGATMKRRVELPVAITSRPVVGEYIQTCCRRIHPDHPVYYISRRACGHDDADDSSRRLATTWDPHIYQTTLYIIYDVGPACMTTPTTHHAAWQLHGTPIYIRPPCILYLLTINMRAAVFHLATLGFPRRPVFLPSTSPPEATRSALVAGSVKGGAGVRLPGFPVFRAPGYAPPSGGHSPASPPSSATGEDRRESITRPGQ